jgi:polyribonucleotide nucleotidyltransferase
MNLKKSLKPIKNKIANKHNAYSTIRQVYKHLKLFSNEEILEYYQVKDIDALKQHIEHIKQILKNKKTQYRETLEEIDTCFCIDSKGDFKYLYTTQKEAQKQLEYSQKVKRVKLKLYPCPYHCGWHLSRV